MARNLHMSYICWMVLWTNIVVLHQPCSIKIMNEWFGTSFLVVLGIRRGFRFVGFGVVDLNVVEVGRGIEVGIDVIEFGDEDGVFSI